MLLKKKTLEQLIAIKIHLKVITLVPFYKFVLIGFKNLNLFKCKAYLNQVNFHCFKNSCYSCIVSFKINRQCSN